MSRHRTERITILNPNTGRTDGTIAADRYRAMKTALLRVLGRGRKGVPFAELSRRAQPHLPAAVFEGASIGWYTTTVKLDLEARGVVERLPGRGPQVVRRCLGRGGSPRLLASS